MLLYGLELILPNQILTERLEIFQKKLLKRLLSVPINTPDSAVYILSGFLPGEAQIHKKALIFFKNVCHQSETSTEKRLAIRQTTVKSMKSRSWFIDIKKLLWKYELGEVEECLRSPLPKLKWKAKANQALYGYWTDIIVNRAALYSSLTYMNVEKYQPGQIHPLLKTEQNPVRDIPRISIKFKVLYGVYTLQSTRASFNQYMVDPTCQVCCSAPETLVHFVLECPVLSTIRNPIINEISNQYNKLNCSKVIFENLSKVDQLKIILDC